MRLTCPSCNARYDVDASLIPPEGRDVQCSNCGATWFQPSEAAMMEPNIRPETEAEQAMPEPPQDASFEEAEAPSDTAPELSPEDAVAQITGAEAEIEVDDQPEAETTPAEEAPPPPPPPPAEEGPDEPTRRELDPALRDILREEREREEGLRRGDGDMVESQGEMALEETPAEAEPQTEADDPFADLRDDEAVEEAVAGAAARESRRELLPDIEEINSTLRATSDRGADDFSTSDIENIDTRPRRRRGFRIGFLLMLILGALAMGIYAYAPQIAEAVPQTAPLLETYTAQIDALRLNLADLAERAAAQLNALASGEE